MRVERGLITRFGYLESRLFNMAYWRGETFFADHELVVGAPYCANRGPMLTTRFDATVYGSPVTLQWNAVAGATSYRVYTATPGTRPQLRATTTATQAAIPFANGCTYWWVESTFAQCPAMRSDAGRLDVRPLAKRRAVR